jgi:hypothetical protein
MASKLEELGNEFRKLNIIKNDYTQDPADTGSEYSATHKNAISDGDVNGKGTNDGGDTINTSNGGGFYDIYGNEKLYPGSGRNALIAKNEAKYDNKTGVNGYGPNKPYTHPDMSGPGKPVEIGKK